MPAIDICFYATEHVPEGRWVATAVEGRSKIHLLTEDGSDTLCGQSLDGMAAGRVRGELDTLHSDVCKNCLRKDDLSL